jgi:hypothetical protein
MQGMQRLQLEGCCSVTSAALLSACTRFTHLRHIDVKGAGTQLACFTGTKVQILTTEEQSA